MKIYVTRDDNGNIVGESNYPEYKDQEYIIESSEEVIIKEAKKNKERENSSYLIGTDQLILHYLEERMSGDIVTSMSFDEFIAMHADRKKIYKKEE